MADGTEISWTDATWNPITGCSVVSPGCSSCYAMRLAGTRLRNHPSRAGLTKDTKAGPVWTGEVRFNQQWLEQPLHWREPRDIFVCAHSDLFHEAVPNEWLRQIFDVMRRASWHRYQVLTKRPHCMRLFLENQAPVMHALIGVSVEDQRRADERREHIRAIADGGWRTWVSYEPALGPVDWAGWQFIRWMVSGGESGPGARPTHPDWHRATRDWCGVQGVPFHFKQWGQWAPFGSGVGMNFLPKPNAARALICHSGRRVTEEGARGLPDDDQPARTYRVGKKAAGRHLDGVLHDAMLGVE